jgi:hypothetical protein
MDISDIIFHNQAPLELKQAIITLMDKENITSPYMRVLTPTASNNDVNGSQHVRNGGTDFTYRDVEEDDLDGVTGLGYYEYFSETYSGGEITGHYYEGSEQKFEAIVLNPPAYAVTVHV